MFGRTYYHARQNADAIAELRRAIALDVSPLPHFWLGLAHAAEGEYADALDELQKSGDVIMASVAAKGFVLAQSGNRVEAEKVLEQMVARSKTTYVPGNFIAQVYAGLGDRGEAFFWLEKSYQEHAYQLIFLRVDPVWDSIRDDTRFADLVGRVGIPSEGAPLG
jgi:tetratricopeptide (TPR) repeat protein